MSYMDMEKLHPERQDYSCGVDMIGPWTIEVGNRKEKFSTLTIIDLVTNLVEIICVTNKTSAAVTAHFVNAWLAHYPKPMSCRHDPGLEFIGWNFQEMLHCKSIFIVRPKLLEHMQHKGH
jgi:hypothetical protein